MYYEKKLTYITVSIILLLILVLSVFFIELNYNKTTKNSSSTYLINSKDISSEEVINQLIGKGIIRNKTVFKIYSRFYNLNPSLKASNIIIKPNISVKELIEKLNGGRSDFAIITIPEGFSLHQIANRLEKNNLINKDVFMNLKLNELDNNGFISERKNIIYDMEGFLFADTYYIPYGKSEKEIAQLMFNRFKNVFSEKDIKRTKELGLDVNQIITIASLIEKEAMNDSERSRIAGVIYNRIKKGMLLQIDAAVIYANTKGEKNLEKVYYSYLKVDSKYNTYLYKGLPPGPIASPGIPSIQAALYPEKNDYLYYVAGKSGHVFSKTYEEHEANVKKYIK